MSKYTDEQGDALVKQVENLTKELEQATKKNDELQEEIVKLKAESLKNVAAVETAAPAKPVIPSEPVKIGDREYKFRVPVFTIVDKKYTAEEAATDKELLASILKIEGQGILKPVS